MKCRDESTIILETMAASTWAEKVAVTVGGHEVWYRTAGAGIPILILVGWGGPSDKYFALQDELADKGYRVVLPDLPGLPGKATSILIPTHEWGKWIDELGKAAIGQPFILLSHSLSALIALQCLSKEHSECRGGVFIDPWLISSSFQAFLWRCVARIVRFLCPVVYPDMKWVRDKKAWATAIGLLSRAEEQPGVPCVVLRGKRDPARRLFRGWRELRCETRQYDWDHSPQIRATRELAAVIDEFIRHSATSEARLR